jgi:adenylate cyclase, class 2
MPTAALRRNVELKARLPSLADARRLCRELAEFVGDERQVDTYFNCRHGRLKLRQREGNPVLRPAENRPAGSVPLDGLPATLAEEAAREATFSAADQLVWYLRPDAAATRASDYTLMPVADAATLKAVLTAALGVLVVVEKRREVYLHRNVRIHLDQVEQLGEFLEFEAVLGPGDDEVANAELVRQLSRRVAVSPAMLIDGSYSDLLLVKRAGGG